MNEHTLRVLEYHSFLELLAGYAASEAGKERIRASRPAERPGPEMVHNPLYSDAMRLRRGGETMPGEPFTAPDEILRRAAPEEAVLHPEDVRELTALMRTAESIRRFLGSKACTHYTALRRLGERFPDLAPLLAKIDAVFDPDGEIRNGASQALARIRRQAAGLDGRIHERLERMLHQFAADETLQDQYVAIRNQRYVIPVPRQFKSRVPGIVHDQSNSGRTLFIEPQSVVPDGNQLAQLRLDERDEIRRILRDLCRHIRLQRNEIRVVFQLLGEYDVVRAVSHWAVDYDCCFPQLGAELDLRRARHPLLQAQFREAGRERELVPLDLKLRPETRVLAITGSNTGGKTVVLKTVGLLVLINQSGYPVPAAEETVIPTFEVVMADIGDEQSLTQNLSTFSGHLRNIVDISDRVGRAPALVLLDELGAGTDPVEGGALACALIDHLAATRTVTLATTHLGMIKTHVHNAERMESASVGFDFDSLKPLYKLRIGRPGASHALAIARRLDVPEPILRASEAFMGEDHVRMESMLASLESGREELEAELATAREARDRIVAEREALKDELDALRLERRRLLHKAQQEAASVVENTRREMNKLIKQVQREQGRETAAKARKQLEERAQRLKKSADQTAPKPERRRPVAALTVGDSVRVPRLQASGTLVALDGKRATVDVNGMRVAVKTAELGAVSAAEQAGKDADVSPPEASKAPVGKPKGSAARQEVNLVGLRVDPALGQLERFLDKALLAGLTQLRVVHGFGTGKLKQAVHEYLRYAPGVSGFRLGLPGKDPGGAGVTIVELE